MKCKHCDGDGVIVDVEYGHAGKYMCDYCWGKGVVEPLTEQEYIQTCNTEQLAEFLADKCNEVVETVLSDASCGIGDIDNDDYWYRRKDFVEWLKQPHTKE